MKKEVGFSIGTLYGKDLTLAEKVSLLSGEHIATIELSFWEINQFLKADLEPVKDQLLSDFSSLSLHTPWKWIIYADDTTTREVLKKLESWHKDFNFSGIVIHPDIVSDFYMLDVSGLPFCMENVDSRKTFGTHPEHFHEIIQKYNFGFVLDVEHAYEHDPEMRLAKELVHLMWDRLKHMHVSWCSKDQLHVPVYLSENEDSIRDFLSSAPTVPYILEWVLDGDIGAGIHLEYNYISSL